MTKSPDYDELKDSSELKAHPPFSKAILIWLLIGIPLVGAFIMRKSFNLGLYGDDWQHLYNMWRDFFVYKTKSFFDIRSYLNPYWPNYLYLGIINYFWGFYPPAYFIASYLLKMFATISLYFLSFKLTKSKLAAFLATVIFLFSAAGLQTTDWVFNMNTYAGLGLLMIATVYYLKIRQSTNIKIKHYLLFIFFFILALAIVPTRMHGAVPFLIISDIFFTFILEKGKKINRYVLIRIFVAIGIFALLSHFKSFGEGSFATERLADSSEIIKAFTQKGYHIIWFYFLGILGHLVLPDSIGFNTYRGVILFSSLLSIILGIIISASFLKTKRLTAYLPVLIFNIIWGLILSWMVSINPNPVPNLNPYSSYSILFSIALGGQFIFWCIWLFTVVKKHYLNLASSFIISLVWIITLTFIYWSFTPHYIIETTSRYMTMGAAGFAIFLGSFISLLFFKGVSLQKNEATRVASSFYFIVPTFILLFWIIVNFQKSEMYLGTLEQTRNKQLTKTTWDTLLNEVPKLDPEGPSVFFFTTDNPLSLEGVLVFGFFMRAGMTYRIPNQDLTPLPSTNYEEILSYVKDGSPLKKVHGRKAIPVPLSRIFGFDFRNGQLINITPLLHQKIKEDLK